ncbi:tubulin glycylase 3A-like isoform X2 [Trichoplusia ni]|uniref:Tubulin glycylase 3A-like isoform X2 n=1 Tax=Trichoplusia ni TaxID=7111 RepID=A0A7E5WCZ2_TRINI|nr:tubulin glycylase 3A-like isoform X2 [Trichoplusia ni]
MISICDEKVLATKSSNNKKTKKYEAISGTFSSVFKKTLRKKHKKSNLKKIKCESRFDLHNNSIKVTEIIKTTKTMPNSHPYRHGSDGLSPKEKSYVICSCQARSNRYVTLKTLATQAIREGKIFSVYGACNAVRLALLERGWVEKIPPNRMNLAKIRNGVYTSKPEVHGELERLLLSNLVEKYPPNFIWRTREELRDTTIDMNRENSIIVNKLKSDVQWTSKQGLCSSMKRNYWFYIEDVAEVIGPRTYNTYDSGEIEGFVNDFKITACTSLLKWILSMVANDRPVFVETGKISLNVVLFALNRCKEYLFRKQHKDIDRSVTNVSSGQWNAFLKKYYRVIARDDVFQVDTENKLPLYLSYAKFLLKEIHRYRPQLSCEGCHNIWIIKPAHNSRGRGIRMASRLAIITNLLSKANAKYVIQKYIEEPLLIHETKFDIRQYCLVTSTYPLVIWMYKDCYLKFSSQKYNLKNYHESIHLTNNAVQRKYTNCAGRHEELPTANMWDSDKYKDYLNRIDKGKVWDKIIYPGMKKTIIGIMLSCQDSLSVCKNRFELYGCDFILDKEYKPWLIEINASPDLNHTTPVTAKICPAVLHDIIKVVIDRANNSKSPTGKFECIYRQPMTTPRYGGALDLFVRGISLPSEYFYKGNIEIKESYDDDVDIEKEKNIQAILEKIKQQSFDTDIIMKEPDDDSEAVFVKKEQETNTLIRGSRSEYELHVAASVITGQLDELMERVTSEHSVVKAKLKASLSPKSLIAKLKPALSAKSISDFKPLLQSSLGKAESNDVVYNQRSFNFSHLDDGPVGKASDVDVDKSPKSIFKSLKQVEPLKLLSKQESIENAGSSSMSEDMIAATSKLINFINRKEKEYFNGFR